MQITLDRKEAVILLALLKDKEDPSCKSLYVRLKQAVSKMCPPKVRSKFDKPYFNEDIGQCQAKEHQKGRKFQRLR